jgi:hypothetical protein
MVGESPGTFARRLLDAVQPAIPHLLSRDGPPRSIKRIIPSAGFQLSVRNFSSSRFAESIILAACGVIRPSRTACLMEHLSAARSGSIKRKQDWLKEEVFEESLNLLSKIFKNYVANQSGNDGNNEIGDRENISNGEN